MKKYLIFIIIPLGLLIDFTSKYLVKHNLSYGVPKEILGDFLRFTYVENTGVIFGIGHNFLVNFPILKNLILVVLALFIMVIIFREYRITQDLMSKVLYIFIITGALGNLLERIFGHIIYNGQWQLFYGGIVDFIDIGFGNWRWFFFNFADAFISVSIVILMVRIIILEKRSKQESKQNNNNNTGNNE